MGFLCKIFGHDWLITAINTYYAERERLCRRCGLFQGKKLYPMWNDEWYDGRYDSNKG